ncbi:Uncharacterized protein TCM_002516 [Theobroma cacao]|uniref:BED-type domain-containing protein n=1 Tax=Theobroma cacao TaxID=3641 RepID=A0A061DUH0_THECC|nr:Uncharacterized protein TCM_002516 [Theobroma cacao]
MSEVWKHFTKFINNQGESKARCNYCGRELSVNTKYNGTNALKNHMNSCEKFSSALDYIQIELAFQSDDGVALLNELKIYKIAISREEDKSKLEKYLSLNEPDVTDNDDFNVLILWKFNNHRYLTLALQAHDILVIPPSIIASESVFSTGGWVRAAYRSSLSPKMVQALICAQD